MNRTDGALWGYGADGVVECGLCEWKRNLGIKADCRDIRLRSVAMAAIGQHMHLAHNRVLKFYDPRTTHEFSDGGGI